MEHKRDFEIIDQPGGAAVVQKDTYIRSYGSPDEREKVYRYVMHVTTRHNAEKLLSWIKTGKLGDCPVKWAFGWEGPGWYAGRMEGPGWDTFYIQKVAPEWAGGNFASWVARGCGLGTPRLIRTTAEFIKWVGK